MTTNAFSTVFDHSGDAGFRAWGSEFSASLAAVGLVQTADTGQINWVTVTRPAINTAGGYEIWRFADSTYYLKFEYGTGGVLTTPQMWITVGTGSNGSGTLTGQLSTRSIFTALTPPTSTITAYPSHMCAVADAFSVSWKEGGVSGGMVAGYLVIGKTVNGSGGAITTGVGILRHTGSAQVSPSIQSVRNVATAATYNDVTTNIVVPGDPNTSSTASTGNSQAYQIPINVPDVLPFNWACTVLLTEAPRGNTIAVAMVGVATRTYYSPGQISNANYGPYVTNRYAPAMIYE